MLHVELARRLQDSTMIGFLDGPHGIFTGNFVEITDEIMDGFRNTGVHLSCTSDLQRAAAKQSFSPFRHSRRKPLPHAQPSTRAPSSKRKQISSSSSSPHLFSSAKHSKKPQLETCSLPSISKSTGLECVRRQHSYRHIP